MPREQPNRSHRYGDAVKNHDQRQPSHHNEDLKPSEKQNNRRYNRSPDQGAAGPMASSRSDWGRSGRWNPSWVVPIHGALDGFVWVALTAASVLLHMQDRLTPKLSGGGPLTQGL